jgi:uncharacterized protein YjbJ (UPF0337 family)
MKLEIVLGRVLQLTGKAFQFWGQLTGNEIQRLKGYQMVAVGQMKVLGAQAVELLRYCTPRQALDLQPVLSRGPRRFGDRLSR